MRGLKLKQTVRDSAPTILVTVGAESSPAPFGDPRAGTPHILDRSHVNVCRRGPGGWGPVRSVECPGWADVWDVVDGLASCGRRVYVVAGRASDLLTQLHWWERVERGEVSVWENDGKRKGVKANRDDGERKTRHPLVISGRPDLIGYTLRGCSFRWVSVTNWAGVSIAEAARQVGYPIPDEVDHSDKWESPTWSARAQADVIGLYVRRLIDWWLRNGCGVWKDTPGAASWSSFLRRPGAGEIVQHADPRAKDLEDRACYGGRASAFYLGAIGDPERWAELAGAPTDPARGFGLSGPVTRYDVRSMYPALLRDQRYPVALLSVVDKPSVSSLRAGLKGLLAVASVTVSSRRGNLPQRVGKGVAYPVGSWRVVLSSPELADALSRGEVESVHRVAWYTPGTPFRSWSEWVLGLREKARADGDPAAESWVKLLANSLGGRLARRKMGWESRPGAYAAELWGHWHHLDADTGETCERRCLGGLVQQMVRGDGRPATLAACYAHLTAYGRVRMNSVREVAGRRECVWQDTDGVLLTDLGANRIEASEHFHPTEFGKLRREESYSQCRILTAKHYWCDGRWTLAGIHDGFSVDDNMEATQTMTLNPVRVAARPDDSAVYRVVQGVDLSSIEPGTEVGHDGWAIPPSVNSGGEPPQTPKGTGEMW